MPIDAEGWLVSRGVRREPLVVRPAPDAAPLVEPRVGATEERPAGAGPAGAPDVAGPEVAGPEERPPSVREVIDLARQSARDRPVGSASVEAEDAGPQADEADESTTSRSDDVDAALGFIRRSTSNAPQSEGRLRVKLGDRGHDEATVERALERAREERLVDDDALLGALIVERRDRGHADARLRRDLRDRGFTGPQVDEALRLHASTDPAAAAFAVAREQAARHRAVDAETAVRRTVGALVRRGHGEGLARKAARDAVYADREAQQVAGH
jgi:regulatory protein